MLAVQWPAAFDDPGWWFEVKWDGVRVIVESDPGRVRLWSRTGKEMTDFYPEATGVSSDKRVVIDGEIVALDDNGVPSFSRLQQRMNRVAGRTEAVVVRLVVFDVLEFDGPLLGLPIEERWKRLADIDLGSGIRSDSVRTDGVALFEAAAASSLEGIVAKRAGSLYQPGRRSHDWRKIPIRRRTQAVVGGFTMGEGDRTGGFGALQLGLWDHGELVYVGAVGTGFDRESLSRIRETLEQIRGSDVILAGDWPRETVVVEPVLVAYVEFLNWTTAGRLRGPAFVGLSSDPSENVTLELEGPGDIDAENG